MRSTLSGPKTTEKIMDSIVVALTLFISNRRTWLCLAEVNKPLFSCEAGNWILEIIILLALLLVVIWLIKRQNFSHEYQIAWTKNWALLGFLLFSILSFAWTINWVGTLQRVLQVFPTTLIAAYLGLRYSEEDWIRILFWFTAIVTALSYLLVLVLPGAAIMTTDPLIGSWRGVFSHKNYMGSILAFGNALTLFLFALYPQQRRIIILATLVYLSSMGLIVMSQSTTGLVLVMLLHGIFFVSLFWSKYRERFRPYHYLSFGALVILLLAFFLLNLNLIFSIVGKNSTFTGRMPLWDYLLKNVVTKAPVVGQGFGTVWTFESFRIELGKRLGWISDTGEVLQIINAHNGYLDVLLYLGYAGLTLFGLVCGQTVWRAIQRIREQKSIKSIFGLFTIAYVLVTNITISFFFEFEVFHWVLLVIVLFISAPSTATRQIEDDALTATNAVSASQ